MVRGGATADENSHWVVVWCRLWHYHGGALERVCSSGIEPVDRSRHVGHDAGGFKCVLVEDSCLIVIGDKDATTRKDRKEGVKIVGIGAVEPVAVYQATARRFRKDLEVGNRWSVGAILSSDNQDRSVRHHHGRRIPTSGLERHLIDILLPIVHTWDARGPIRPVQPDSIKGICRPASNIELPSNFVRKRQSSGTEHIRLETVHGPPGSIEVIDLSQIQLIGTRGVRRTSPVLLDESDFAGQGLSSDERYNYTADQELVFPCCVAGSLVPGIEAGPGVVIDGIRSTTESCRVAAARRIAVLVSLESGACIDTVGVVPADCEMTLVGTNTFGLGLQTRTTLITILSPASSVTEL